MTDLLSQKLAEVRKLPGISMALVRLKNELPNVLKYHVAAHTDDVMSEAFAFAIHDNLSTREFELLAIAVAFHDLGFVESLQENEALGAELAGKAMISQAGYRAEEIEIVKSMILATQVRVTTTGPRQVASNELSKYLLDADVSNLGRDDFFAKAELVRQEIPFASKETFYTGLIGFMQAHQWYTPAAKKMRQTKKDENYKVLQAMVASQRFP